MRFLNNLRRWRIIVPAILLLVVAAGAFALLRGTSNQNSPQIEEDQQLIPVRRGDLIQEISITGSLSLPDRETLAFGSSGVIADIMVQEGDKVTAGQTLAILDQEDIAALEEKVIEARVDLRDAQDALEDYLSPSDLHIANARKDVADAELSLQDSLDALDALENPSLVSISQIEARMVNYQVELDNIAEQIADLREPPTQLRIDQARKNVASARLELERAQETLQDTLTEDPDEANEIQNARNNLDSAARELPNSEADLEVVRREWDVKLADAGRDVSDKAETYADVFSKWLGISPDPDAYNPDYEIALSDLGVNLQTLFDLSNRFSDLEQGGYYSDGLPADDTSTAWNETTVFLWLNLNPTDLEVACEPGDAPKRGICIQEEFRAPSEAYISALDNLNELEAQAGKSVSAAQTAFDRAQNQLNAAQSALDNLTEPVEPTLLAEMEADIQLAMSTLADAEEKLDELLNPEDVSLSINNLESQAELAQANLQQAQEDLEELLSGKEQPEHPSLLQDIDVARLNLEDKQQDLQDLIVRDPQSLDLATLQVNLASAEVALGLAEERLADSTMIAPFDGFIAKLNVEEDDEVERHTDIMVVVNTGIVELDGGVDEIDVLQARVGAQASVEVDALPEQPITGEIFSIAAEPASGQGQGGGGIVTYPVTIRLSVPDGVDLPAGLSAVASITISEERAALLVPLDALRGSFNRPTLYVMTNNEIVETPVTLGDSDEFWTVVTGGVNEGDMVVARAPEGYEGEFDITSGPPERDRGQGGTRPPR